MSVNTMSFEQSAALLNSIYKQATGKTSLTPITNNADWISVATSTLGAGVDPVMNAISQMVGRTIFSVRPYSRKFAGLQIDNQRFGSITRKLSIADKDFSDDIHFNLVDGQSVDSYVVNKPNALQLNFYGANVFEKNYTVFKDQLDNSFTSAEQFGEWMSMVTQNASDMIEQAHENLARAVIANGIAAKVDAGQDVIHLLTEYNTLIGASPALTIQDIYKPANFKPFMQFVYSRVAEVCAQMTERSTKFQINVTGKEITRHTPYQDQRVYLYAPYRYQAEMMAIADTFHDNYLRMADTETVNYWQSIDTPDTISCTPVYIDSTGAVKTGNAVSQANVFGIIMDRDAMGYTVINQTTAMTPLSARGLFWNVFHHFTDRYFTDFSEKMAVLLLD